MNYGTEAKAMEAKAQGAGYARAMPPTMNETRQLELPHQLDVLARNTKVLAEMVSSLEARLSGTVMRAESGANSADKQLRGTPSTGFGSQLQEVNDTLAALQMRLESMTARLEV